MNQNQKNRDLSLRVKTKGTTLYSSHSSLVSKFNNCSDNDDMISNLSIDQIDEIVRWETQNTKCWELLGPE